MKERQLIQAVATWSRDSVCIHTRPGHAIPRDGKPDRGAEVGDGDVLMIAVRTSHCDPG